MRSTDAVRKFVAPSLLPPAVFYPLQPVPLNPSVRLCGIFSTPATTLAVGPGDDRTKRVERNSPCACQCLGGVFCFKIGETKQNVTRSVAARLGCLQSPLLYAPFSSTPQPGFPLLRDLQ